MIKSRTAIKIFAAALAGAAVAGCSTMRNPQSEQAWTEVRVTGEPGSTFNVVAIGRWTTKSFDYVIEGENLQVTAVTNSFLPHKGTMISEQIDGGYRFLTSPEVKQLQIMRDSIESEKPLRVILKEPSEFEVHLLRDGQYAMVMCFPSPNFSVFSNSSNYVADADTYVSLGTDFLTLSPKNQ